MGKHKTSLLKKSVNWNYGPSPPQLAYIHPILKEKKEYNINDQEQAGQQDRQPKFLREANQTQSETVAHFGEKTTRAETSFIIFLLGYIVIIDQWLSDY